MSKQPSTLQCEITGDDVTIPDVPEGHSGWAAVAGPRSAHVLFENGRPLYARGARAILRALDGEAHLLAPLAVQNAAGGARKDAP